MLSSRSGKNPNSLRSSNSQWQKKQPPPPPPQQQKQQLISQDPCAAAVGPTLQWPWSAAHLTEQQVAAYNYWYYQQQRLLLEQQQQQQQQQLMNMNNYANQFATEAPPLPPPSFGDLKSRSLLTAFLERDESFLTPWGKRDMTPEGEEFSFGEYASLYGERQPERMVFQYGSSFFSNQLY